MRIVQIEDFFHPNAGYQVNILSKYFAKAGNEVIIVTSELDKIPDNLTRFFGKNGVEKDDKIYEDKYSVKIIRIPIITYISGRVWFNKCIFKVVNELEPDVLYVHGNDTLIAIQYFLRLSKMQCAVISDSHMLEMASKNKLNKLFRAFYKKLIAPRIIQNNIPVIRTQNDPYVEKCLGIPLTNCPWISFGSDTTLFYPDERKKTIFRKNNGINKKDFVVVYAGKLDEAKGGMLLAEAFEKRISDKKNIVLIVIGNTVGEYGKRVEQKFADSENKIIRFPSQNYIDLPDYYQAADIAVFPRQCSLSFYDVQACGLPVISENNSINVERCSNGNGECFEAGDKGDFVEKIRKFAEFPDDIMKKYCKNSLNFILNNFDYEKKAKEYLEVIEKAYNNSYKN